MPLLASFAGCAARTFGHPKSFRGPITLVGTTSAAGGASIALPAGSQADDWITLVYASRNASNNLTPGGTWTTDISSLTTQPSFKVMTRRVAAGETSFSLTWGDTGNSQAAVIVHRNVQGLDVLGTLAANAAGSSVTTIANSITPTRTGELLMVAGHKSLAAGSITPTVGLTARFDTRGDGSVYCATTSNNPAGATGSKSMSKPSGANNQGYAVLLQLY
jgi:hypothetical protein